MTTLITPSPGSNESNTKEGKLKRRKEFSQQSFTMTSTTGKTSNEDSEKEGHKKNKKIEDTLEADKAENGSAQNKLNFDHSNKGQKNGTKIKDKFCGGFCDNCMILSLELKIAKAAAILLTFLIYNLSLSTPYL